MTDKEIMELLESTGMRRATTLEGVVLCFLRCAHKIAAAEREACAKVCDERDDDYGTFTVSECASAIRARK